VQDYLSISSGNNIREKALSIVNRLEGTYIKYAKHKSMAQILLNWIKPHIVNVITKEIPEQELIQILWECKKDIEGLDTQMNRAEELRTSRELNPVKQQKFVESIKENKEALELLP